MTQNRATAIRPEAIQSDYRDFKLSPPILSSRTRNGLIEEIDAWHAEQVPA